MILPRTKPAIKLLGNGFHSVFILSVSESKDSTLTFKFKNNSGQSTLIMPINTYLHEFLCKLGYIAGIKGVVKLSDLVNRHIDVEIVQGRVRCVYKYGQSQPQKEII